MPVWQIAAAGLALAAYAVLSHVLMVHFAQQPWAVAALFGPLLAAVAGGGWLRRQWWLLAACAALVAWLAWLVWRGGVADINRMYVLQHGGIHLALAWTFAITLKAGSTPLITSLAERLHRHFSAEMRAYTRWLTALWVWYFVGMVVVSGLVYALAPWPWWSLFCNVLTPVFAVALFVGEHLIRYVRHPDFERVSLRAAFGAYRDAGQSAGPGPR
jgi:uncharacterized membrane protein